MSRIFLSLLIGLSLLISAEMASAQIKVYLGATAQDMVGGRLAYAIKEGIRRSAAMQLVDREQDGFIRVNLVTLDPQTTSSTGINTIYSVVWTTQTFHTPPVTMFLHTVVGICGSERVAQCADSLVAITDEQVSNIRAVIQTILESPRK
jgi:hypothetical protein